MQQGRRLDGIGEIGVQKINRKGGATSPAFRHEKEFLEVADISPLRRVIPFFGGANVSTTRSESLIVSKSLRKEAPKWLLLVSSHFH